MKSLTGKKILQYYLNPLLNHGGYIDNIESIIDKRANIYFPVLETKKYSNLFQNDNRNNLITRKRENCCKIYKISHSGIYNSVFEPTLKYSSEIGYITKIKNHEEKEITLEELVNQYFKNPEDYFEVRKEEQEQKKETEIEKEVPPTQQEREEKYKREQEEIKKWG